MLRSTHLRYERAHRRCQLGLALVALFFVAEARAQQGAPATYDKSFADRYCVVADMAPSFPAGLALEPEVVVTSPTGISTARVVRTDGTKVAYEEAEAHITVTTEFGAPINLTSRGFRTVQLQWLGERYLFISKGIGRIVAIEEIFDIVERRWLVQQTVSYRVP